MKEKVPLTGLEPVLSALRGRRVNHLHHSGKLVALNGRFALSILLTDSLNVRLSDVPLSLAIVSPKKAGFKSTGFGERRGGRVSACDKLLECAALMREGSHATYRLRFGLNVN